MNMVYFSICVVFDFFYQCCIHSASLCLLVGAFNPFTFKVIIDKYDPIAIYFVVLGSSLYTLSLHDALPIFSFKYEGEIKSFSDKQKLREFSTTKPALQQMLKNLL